MFEKGITLPKLGSVRDRTLRAFILKEAKKEIQFSSLLAMVAFTNPSFDSTQATQANEWSSKVRKILTNYNSAELGLELTEKDTSEMEMSEAYSNFVRTLRPKLASGEHGLVVSGLDKLFVAHGEKPPSPPEPEERNNKKEPRPKPRGTRR